MNTIFKDNIQQRLNSVTAATPIDELPKLKLIAQELGLDDSVLNAVVATMGVGVNDDTPLSTLFALSIAQKPPRRLAEIGQVVRFPRFLPPVYLDSYIRAGNFVTAGFSPLLQQMFDECFGYKSSDGVLTGGTNSSSRGFDIDGAGTIVTQSGDISIQRSTDYGASWTDITSALGITSSTKVVAIRHICGVGVNGVWVAQMINGNGKRSTDGAATWVNIPLLPAVGLDPLLASDATGQYVLAKGGESSLMRSTNYAETFTTVTLLGTNPNVKCVTYVAGSTFVAAGSVGASGGERPCYWISTNNGATWGVATLVDNPGVLGICTSVCYAPMFDRCYFGGYALNRLAAIGGVSTGIPTQIQAISKPNIFANYGTFVGLAATVDGFLFAKDTNSTGHIHKEQADESKLVIATPITGQQLECSNGVISDGVKFYALSPSLQRMNVYEHAVGIYPTVSASSADNDVQYIRYL